MASRIYQVHARVGESPAALAHRYALSIPGVVALGVKNRSELRECIAAERGSLDRELISRIDRTVGRSD